VVSPAPTVVPAGGSGAVQISIKAANGFSGAVSVTITGIPPGVTATPSQFTVTNPVSVTFSAASNISTGNYPVTFQGTSGNLSNSTIDTLQVGPLATFQIIQPSNPELVVRTSSSVQVQLQTSICCPPAVGGYSLNFSAAGLPAGVTSSFSPNPITAGGTTTLTLSAAANAVAVQNLPINVTATPSASTPSRNLSLALDVSPPVGSIPNSRTDFIRTDGTPFSLAYDAQHQLIFASNPEWNRVDVASPLTKQIVRSIPVPVPEGLALTPDGTRVLVGTQTQQLVAIDTSSLAVVQRWYLPAVSFGMCSGQGYATQQVAPLSNGKALVVCNILYTTGTGVFEWDPATNTATQVSVPPTFQVGGVSASADGTKAILYSNVSPGALAIYDSTTESIVAQKSFSGFVSGIQANPNGTRFIASDDNGGLQLYDAQLNVLGPIPPGAYDTGVLFSGDGSRIYVVSDSYGVPVTYTVDATTLTIVGMAPAYATIPPYAELNPPYFIETPLGADSTGLIFGAADQGIALDDSTYFESIFPPANLPIFDKVLSPDNGPVNAATVVQVETSPFDAIPDAWFGSQRVSNASLLNGGGLQLTAPSSAQPGPVNVKLIQPNGVQIFDPLAFSYGPTPLFLSGDSGSPSGGATADIIALGVPRDPSSIQVSIGGLSATVVSAMNFTPTGDPFVASPQVDIKVNLPGGPAGLADVSVTTTAGTSTLPKAFHFVQSIDDYPSPDSFQAVFYDRFRNQVYLSAGDHVDVFSASSNQFVAPLQLPSISGLKQFAGMALTTDGSQLLVANLRDGSVAIINPDSPAGAKAAAIAPSFPGVDGPPCYIGPAYIATTSTGKAFVVYGGVPAVNCGPGGPIYEVDLATLMVTQTSMSSCPQNASFVSASRDGSVLAFGGSISSGTVWSIYSSASNSCKSSLFYQAYGAAASGDGNIFAAQFRITDPQANLLNLMAFPDPYYPGQGACICDPRGNGLLPLMEEKLNDSGSLLYVPFANSVDILDMQHATLSRRVSLKEQIPQIVDALSVDPTGRSMFLITNKGLTVVDLDAAPLSIGSVLPANVSAGSTITIRGSGFLQTTTAKLGTAAVPLTFLDESTLQLTVPALPSGAVQIQLTNPGGLTYTLDDAFTIF